LKKKKIEKKKKKTNLLKPLPTRFVQRSSDAARIAAGDGYVALRFSNMSSDSDASPAGTATAVAGAAGAAATGLGEGKINDYGVRKKKKKN
jgi:hypothetical protein